VVTRELNRVVIAGASAAGLTAAETLRRQGHQGAITLIGAEKQLPYDRPPLSKQILSGTWETERIALRGADTYTKLELDLRLGTVATSLDSAAKTITLDGGETLGYDGLIIATGLTPRRLPQLTGALTLHTLDDALELRSRLGPGARLVVVGAGFLGTEVAASARTLGAEVTVVDPLPVPMSRQFGDHIGRLVEALHRDNGVDLRLSTGVSGSRPASSGTTVELTDGTTIEADVVLSAVGATPVTEWLTDSGLTLRDGVVCDAMCRAADDVYAAGDIARWFNPRFDTSMRVEHRMNATEQGMAAAKNLLGADQPFAPIPYFWSDQYDVKIQAHGHFPPGGELSVIEGAVADRKFVAACVENGRTTGVLGWNSPRQVREARALIA
jgi:3-phenylpropionate/trans-cinnamate dioxygenase ferredoxin reductase subunit